MNSYVTFKLNCLNSILNYNTSVLILNITLQRNENIFKAMHNVRPNKRFYACDKLSACVKILTRLNKQISTTTRLLTSQSLNTNYKN